MTLKQALAALQKAGTAQNRKVYGNHGVSGPMYGVSFAELKKLKKQIKQDHELACGLWDTGNHDARILACLNAPYLGADFLPGLVAAHLPGFALQERLPGRGDFPERDLERSLKMQVLVPAA